MVKFLKDYWFGILMSCLVFFCLLFAVIIAVAPHNDAKMRGFTPCTYQIAADLGQVEKPQLSAVLKIFGTGYECYFSVIVQGTKQYFAGQQKTPWANYFFEPIIVDETEEEGEALSQELIDANMLDDENVEEDNTLFGDLQENDDEK